MTAHAANEPARHAAPTHGRRHMKPPHHYLGNLAPREVAPSSIQRAPSPRPAGGRTDGGKPGGSAERRIAAGVPDGAGEAELPGSRLGGSPRRAASQVVRHG